MSDAPVTGNAIIDGITGALGWLDKRIQQIVSPPAPSAPAPADMTDVQLHRAIHDLGGTLLNRHGRILQESFARYGATMGDPRFPAPMPTTVRAHVLTMIIQANDSYGLALLGLRQHATASALGPIRKVAETYVYAKWLLESPDEKVRLGRAYRLTMNAIDQLRGLKRTLEKVAPQSELTQQTAPVLGTAAERMSRRLTKLAEDDGVAIAAQPKRSHLLEKHLPDAGGYMFYSLLSNTGAHPGASGAQAFYGKPGTAIADYDFKGLHHVRAYRFLFAWPPMAELRLSDDRLDEASRRYLPDLVDLSVFGTSDRSQLSEMAVTIWGPLRLSRDDRHTRTRQALAHMA